MTKRLDERLLSALSEFVAAHMGLYFPRERLLELERGMGSAAAEFGFDDVEACIRWLLSAPLTKSQIEILASQLTIGETYIFRDHALFELLREQVVPELVRRRLGNEQRLRVWSAGCSTGEEPYSLAILLNEIVPGPAHWHLTILAADINPLFLRRAAEGIYTEWSFRNTPPWVRERYFRKLKDGRYELLPQIRKMVTFSYLNLAEDGYPSLLNNTNAMDLILCRNVLMYFIPERAQKAARNFYHCLVDGGWLIVSPAEASYLFSHFAAVRFPGAVLYRKVPTSEFQVSTFPSSAAAEPEIPRLKPRSDFEKRGFSDGPAIFNESSKPEAPKSEIPGDLYEQAREDYDQGRYTQAAAKLAQLPVEDRNDSPVMLLLARVYANQGRLAEALEWCEKAIAADKVNPASHYLLATIQQEHGQIQDAVVSLKRAVYLDENFVLPHFLLGNLSQQQGRPQESQRHFRNALTLLQSFAQDEIVPDSEGMTAGRLSEIIRCTAFSEKSP
ncbi:MAG: CheR family methyltransferase [Candidatus Binatia bacterium]